MKNIEDKILKKVYQEETKHTALDIAFRIILIASFGTILILLLSVLYEIYLEQSTLDILQLFSEDKEVVFSQLGDTLKTLYVSTPLSILLLIISAGLVFFSIIYLTIKNFRRIVTKLKYIISFWLKS